MKFRITSQEQNEMNIGQLITYTINILPYIKTPWVTEITHLEHQKRFVDEQRFGPYKMWHHEHIFKAQNGKILVIDRVSYKIPLGVLGYLAHFIFVKRQLLKIFAYREKAIALIFA